jgi:2-amino-4-hydroxy-6-hydroxymethyldihydropteridine diphosphokinase
MVTWDQWARVYDEIARDFGFSREEDERARDVLAELLADARRRGVSTARLRSLLEGADVTVYGPALGTFTDWHYEGRGGVKIATDPVVRDLLDRDVLPDLIVTDLDGDPWAQTQANQRGSVVIVHAHGDNVDALNTWVPRFQGPILGTTQVAPVPRVHNFGGFTDGDRAVFIADHFRARSITLVGFDFLNPAEKEGRAPALKRRKLQWARALISTVDTPVTHSTEAGEFAF